LLSRRRLLLRNEEVSNCSIHCSRLTGDRITELSRVGNG
jgi:hypothetical protein